MMPQIQNYQIISTIRSQPRLIYLARHPVHNRVQITIASPVTPFTFLQTANHPVILPLLEILEDGRDSYIVEPYLRGGLLLDRLKKFNLMPYKAAYICERLGSALDYALEHDAMYPHLHARDILFDKNGEMFLPGSECQELPRKKRQRFRKIHIQSMGRLLFALLTGHLLPDTKKTYNRIPELANYRRDLDPEYQSIIKRSLDQKSPDRFATTSDMVTALWTVINKPAPIEQATWQRPITITERNLSPPFWHTLTSTIRAYADPGRYAHFMRDRRLRII